MKGLEISSKSDKKTGYKKFKLILLEIAPDSCVINGIGTQYNDNGITWLESSVSNKIDTLINSSVTVEFVDSNEKTDILGHGATGDIKDGIPILSDATEIGHFTNAYIGENDGKKVLIGEGYLDYMRYPDCIDKFIEALSIGETIFGSVEIVKSDGNKGIVYKNGYVDYGRIPIEYEFSGYSILGCGIQPADKAATLLEVASSNLNNESEENLMAMDEKDIAQIVTAVSEICSKNTEFEATITAKDTTISELNACIEKKDIEVSELKISVETLQKALEDLKKEQETIWEEKDLLEKEIAKIKVEKRLADLNTALGTFSDDEVKLVQAEIDTFKADPMTSEVNSITNKIYAEIGKKAKEQAKVSEINSKTQGITDADIFGDIYTPIVSSDNDDVSIY